MTTVANDGKVHLGSAERGATDEGVPLCGVQAWSLPRTQAAASCLRCVEVWNTRRHTFGGMPVAYATPLPFEHPASRLPVVGGLERLASGVTVGDPFAGAWPPGADVEIVEMVDYRPRNLPSVVVRVERVDRLAQLRRAGARTDQCGALLNLDQLVGFRGRLDLDEGDAVCDPRTGLPRGLDADAAARAAVWRSTGRSSFERAPA